MVGDLYLLTDAAVADSAAAFAAAGTRRSARLVPQVRYLAPISFVVATEFMYWPGLDAPAHRVAADPRRGAAVRAGLAPRVEPLGVELRRGAWAVGYLLAAPHPPFRTGKLRRHRRHRPLDELSWGRAERLWQIGCHDEWS